MEVKCITFIGGYLENGAWPWASSSAVIPNDQMSALFTETQKKGSDSQVSVMNGKTGADEQEINTSGGKDKSRLTWSRIHVTVASLQEPSYRK